MKDKQENRVKLSMMNLNPYVVDTIVSAEEKEIRGMDYISWGDRNIYPQYIYKLYSNSPTLKSAIESIVNYIKGDEIKSIIEFVNDIDTIEDIIELISRDFILYGCFALNVVRNRLGGIAQVHYLDVKNLRSDKKNEIFYYSEDWATKSYGRVKSIKYPRYNKDSKDASSIFFYKNNKTSTYGIPIWSAAVTAVEMETRINEFQLNNVINGFAAPLMVSLNNGVPSDEVKEQIERGFDEKFCSNENSGRLIISYSDDKEHAPEFIGTPEDKMVDKYNTAVARAREQILCVFRAHPVLLGIPTEQSAFNDQDFGEAFLLFNKTVIFPLQKTIVRQMNNLYETADISIEPFTISFDTENGSEMVNETVEN